MVLYMFFLGFVNLSKTSVIFVVKVSFGLEIFKDVVVVGGGLVGMVVVRKFSNLSDKFFVKVLEVRKERYGGRVYTKREYGVRGNGLMVK